MNEQMKSNLKKNGNIQYFCDSTYDYIPPHNKGMKLP